MCGQANDQSICIFYTSIIHGHIHTHISLCALSTPCLEISRFILQYSSLPSFFPVRGLTLMLTCFVVTFSYVCQRHVGDPLRVYMDLEAGRKRSGVEDLFISYHAKDDVQSTYAGALFHNGRNYHVSSSKNNVSIFSFHIILWRVKKKP